MRDGVVKKMRILWRDACDRLIYVRTVLLLFLF